MGVVWVPEQMTWKRGVRPSVGRPSSAARHFVVTPDLQFPRELVVITSIFSILGLYTYLCRGMRCTAFARLFAPSQKWYPNWRYYPDELHCVNANRGGPDVPGNHGQGGVQSSSYKPTLHTFAHMGSNAARCLGPAAKRLPRLFGLWLGWWWRSHTCLPCLCPSLRATWPVRSTSSIGSTCTRMHPHEARWDRLRNERYSPSPSLSYFLSPSCVRSRTGQKFPICSVSQPRGRSLACGASGVSIHSQESSLITRPYRLAFTKVPGLDDPGS